MKTRLIPLLIMLAGLLAACPGGTTGLVNPGVAMTTDSVAGSVTEVVPEQLAVEPATVNVSDQTTAKVCGFLSEYGGSMAELEKQLLVPAKRQAASTLFGEEIRAITVSENFVVTEDQIEISVAGKIRSLDPPELIQGVNLGQICMTATFFVTEEDRQAFSSKRIQGEKCTTTEQFARDEIRDRTIEAAMVETLIKYDARLRDVPRQRLLRVMQNTEYLEDGFKQDTPTYCVKLEGDVIPVQIAALLEELGRNKTGLDGQVAPATATPSPEIVSVAVLVTAVPSAIDTPTKSPPSTTSVPIPSPTSTITVTAPLAATPTQTPTRRPTTMPTATVSPPQSPSPTPTATNSPRPPQPTSTPTPVGFAAPILLNIGYTGAGNPILQWQPISGVTSPYRYGLVVAHANGQSWIITDATSWTAPNWLKDYPPAGGYSWKMAICKNGLVGEYGNSEQTGCTWTSPWSETRFFSWSGSSDPTPKDTPAPVQK